MIPADLIVQGLLRVMALLFNSRQVLQDSLRCRDGWLDYGVGVCAEGVRAQGAIQFRRGRARVRRRFPEQLDVRLIFRDSRELLAVLAGAPHELPALLARNRVRVEGNLRYLALFVYHLSLLTSLKQRRRGGGPFSLRGPRRAKSARKPGAPPTASTPAVMPAPRERLGGAQPDPGVRHLEDPYLSGYSLAEFPRLGRLLERRLEQRPELCPERARLLTEWFRLNGFETDPRGEPWQPELRQALAFRHLMENRRPIIGPDDLLAGTTTSKELGVPIYPDARGAMLWAELLTLPHRAGGPCAVDAQTVRVLHRDVFPYWTRRCFREWVREHHGAPACQQLEETSALYLAGRTVGIAQAAPDLPRLLRLGVRGMVEEIEARLQELERDGDPAQRGFLKAMVHSLEGMSLYAENLAVAAGQEARAARDPQRRAELERLAEICATVPRNPARSLDEAVNAIWIACVCLHQESTNLGLSLGRLDQTLQPYLDADMAGCVTAEEREQCLRHALDLLGCLFLRCGDHRPATPVLEGRLFAGAPPLQAVTIGGVTPQGADAVNDMTYLLLKVTELLGLAEPQVNARYHPGVNSETYLRRVCEVIRITGVSPALHNDNSVIAALEALGRPSEEARDWAVAGAAAPAIPGRQMAHGAAIVINLPAAMEMALNRGRHPAIGTAVAADSAADEQAPAESFPEFETLFAAVADQLRFLVEQSTAYDRLLGEAHATLHPTPLLSALTEGCLSSARDVTCGGARFTSSGVLCAGLGELCDSLLAIRRLVFENGKLSLPELVSALAADFAGHEELLSELTTGARGLGTGEESAVTLANRIIEVIHEACSRSSDHCGGRYTPGLWCLADHIGFGLLTGALPCGRRAGRPLSPGANPRPDAANDLLDELLDVARLEHSLLPGGACLGVKLELPPAAPHAPSVEEILHHVETFFQLGGMCLQLDLVPTEVLRAAMETAETHSRLPVRVGACCARFQTLARSLQLELLRRQALELSPEQPEDETPPEH
jgi:formate C-acetyltransferase